MDLTAITTPFGLLDTATREALKAHGGPYEHATPENNWDWYDCTSGGPVWRKQNVYRVKPQPPKLREWWLEREPSGLVTYAHFEPPEKMDGRNELIRVREYIE